MRILTIANNDLSQAAELLIEEEADTAGVRQTVRNIISQVRENGDQSLLELTNQLDRNELRIEDLRVQEREIDEAYNWLSEDLKKALELSSVRVHNYYEKQMPQDLDYQDKIGVRLGARWLPVESAGLYVPGGTATYPSSVIMNAIPAKVAGVERIVMVTPAMDGKVAQIALAAAKVCGITEVYRIGGAQAVAALAYGTDTIPAVDKIVGPGNAYVAEAKRQVFGKVGIDMVAGPSEILVIADEYNNPRWLAADLLSQAEHDTSARSILVTNSQKFAQEVVAEIYDIIPNLSRKEIAKKSIEDNGLVIVVEDLEQACEIANIAAAEHLELAVQTPDDYIPLIKNAGALFIGAFTPEAMGDYIAGPSHVLPTMRNSKFSSGLSIYDFLKRQSIIGCSKEAFNELAEATELLAETEGLDAHKYSVTVRKNSK